jgi:hypothetical protein
MQKDNEVRWTRYYANVPKGRKGTVTRVWRDPRGVPWAAVFLGVNLSGQRLMRHVPQNVLEVIG